jgi:SAM-dependent methyltransferase
MSEGTAYTHPEIPELYDHIPLYNSRRDVDFYVNLCRQAGDVLELGCGTGRVFIPAAQAGCEVTGLDKSSQMLARCRAKVDALPAVVRDRVTLVEADMTDFQLSRTFPLAIAPFRPVQHLITVTEQLAFLRCVHQHLQPGGRFVFDVFHPDLARLAAPIDPGEIEDTPEVRLPDGRGLRRTFRIVRKRSAEQCNDCELIYYLTRNLPPPAPAAPECRRVVQSFPMRYFFRFEVEHLLARAGFEVTALYGSMAVSTIKPLWTAPLT